MYDPQTVAFEIRSPFGKVLKGLGHDYRYRYHAPWFTFWHVDPEVPGRGNRTDDSCGWFRPPTTKAEREAINKIAAEQYGTIFEKQVRTREGASYAYVCFHPTAYDAIYWSWRAIKFAGQKGWRFGERRNALTASELQAIYTLSANPVDNLRVTVDGINSASDFEEFFHMVWGAYRRHHRPWYRHPRWHVHHWKIQWHWLQDFNRWAFERCHECGGRFTWGETVHGSWGGDKIWHSRCDTAHVPHDRERAMSAAD